MSTELLLLRHL